MRPPPVPTDSPVASNEIYQTVIVKPIATLVDGTVTRHEEQLVPSLIVVHPLSGTRPPRTLLSQPATGTITFEQGSAAICYHEAAYTHTLNPGVLEEVVDRQTQNCTLSVGKLSESCAQVLEVPQIDGTSTRTRTYSESLTPFATATSGMEAPKNGSRISSFDGAVLAATMAPFLFAFLVV